MLLHSFAYKQKTIETGAYLESGNVGDAVLRGHTGERGRPRSLYLCKVRGFLIFG